MATTSKVNIDGTWKQVSTMAVNIGGVWKAVVGAWINIGGVWKSFFTKELSYYGTATALSSARHGLVGASVGNYALFAGGYVGGNVVDAYDTSLTRSTPTVLSQGRAPAGTFVNGYALFGGGLKGDFSNVVDTYNTSLTRSTATALSTSRQCSGTTLVDYALFGADTDTPSDVVDAYDTSLTRTIPTKLNIAKGYLSSASVGVYALFAGGRDSASTASAIVDVYQYKQEERL